MGYTTDFTGHVTINPPLNAAEVAYLQRFSESRRYHRNSGPWETNTDDHRGPDTINYNSEQPGQPGLWCNWVPSADGAQIAWDGMEKFYDAEQWMRYLIDTFLKPGAHLSTTLTLPVSGWAYAPGFAEFTFDHHVNGVIHAQGERDDDAWDLIVEDNVVSRRNRPTLAERVADDPELRMAFDRLKAEGVTVSQFAAQTGQDY